MNLHHSGFPRKYWAFPTTQRLCLARVKATFILRISERNPTFTNLSGSGSRESVYCARTAENMTRSFSRPWNPSTVLTSMGQDLPVPTWIIKFINKFTKIHKISRIRVKPYLKKSFQEFSDEADLFSVRTDHRNFRMPILFHSGDSRKLNKNN